MYKVIKRDGSVAEFDIAKISGAIAKAFGALNKPCDPNDIDFIALKVTADFEDKIKDDLISVEAIQDSAEQVLIQSGHSDVAKAIHTLPKGARKASQPQVYYTGLQGNGKQLRP